MAHYLISSPRDERFSVRVGDCTREHAETVFAQLLVEPTVPSDLELVEVEGPDSVRPRRLVDRLLRR